jgi:hypothetical protein
MHTTLLVTEGCPLPDGLADKGVQVVLLEPVLGLEHGGGPYCYNVAVEKADHGLILADAVVVAIMLRHI